jgi:hypothetical protein
VLIIWCTFAFALGGAVGAVASIMFIIARLPPRPVTPWVTPYCCARFDTKEWIAAGAGSDWQVTEKEEKCIRGRMVGDLRRHHLRPGMRKEELISLLGKPTQSEDDRVRGCLSYSIGYCRGLGFDLNVMTFCFNADGGLINDGGTVRR